MAGIAQLLKSGAVVGHPLGLVHHRFFPAQPEPVQVFQRGLAKLRFAALRVEVLIAIEQGASSGLRAFLGGPKRARVTEVQVARGRRRDAADVAHASRNRSVNPS